MLRIRQFARFLGVVDRLGVEALHFYLHCVTMMIRAIQGGPLYPEPESPDSMLCGIATPAACAAGQKVLERFSTGRSLKFYVERLTKIAGEGMMRFNGKNLAEFDQVLDYMLTAYIDECSKVEDAARERFADLPGREVTTYSQFHSIVAVLPQRPPVHVEHRLMRELLACDHQGLTEYLQLVRRAGFDVPLALTQQDFLAEQNQEDVVKLMQLELTEHMPLYEELLKTFVEGGDDVMAKQLKSSKAKLDQSLQSRIIGRASQAVQREFYEKLFLTQILIERQEAKN
jgi:hypothetical protein